MDELRCGLYTRVINNKPKKSDGGFGKLELIRVKYHPLAGTFCQESADCVIVGGDVLIKQERVIDAFPVITEIVANNFIHPYCTRHQLQ